MAGSFYYPPRVPVTSVPLIEHMKGRLRESRDSRSADRTTQSTSTTLELGLQAILVARYRRRTPLDRGFKVVDDFKSLP